jgi:hypothetical protein
MRRRAAARGVKAALGILLALAGTTLAGGAAAAQSATVRPAKDCRDDDMVDRCDPEKQRQVRELFGVAAIEALAAEGARVRRAFYVDGYGNDMPVVTFARSPGRPPGVTVTARVFAGEGKVRLVKMSQAIREEVWDEVLRRGRHFDRRIAPEPPPPPKAGAAPPPVNICLHAWVVTVEAGDPASERPELRRATQDACDEGLAVDYGMELARLAVEAFPACRALDPENHRNDVARLQACALLEGDTPAAAAVMNRFRDGPFGHLRESELGEGPPLTVNSPARLSWAGEEARGWKAALELWRKRAVGTAHQPGVFHGESEARVRVTGHVRTSLGEDTRVAPFEQVWVKERGLGSWSIEQWTVGTFAEPPPRDR